MLKNRLVQLIYHIIFLMICFLGILDCLNLLIEQRIDLSSLVYYTTLSNVLCFIVIFLVTIKNYQDIKNNKMYGKNNHYVRFKFYSMVIIFITFLIYNFILVDNIFTKGWSQIGNLTKHILSPLLFIIDFYLFDEYKKLNFFDTLIALSMPLFYCSVIVLRGALLPFDYKGVIYPYFFLNINEVGFEGLIRWILLLAGIFYLTALIFYISTIIIIKIKKRFLNNK